MNWFEVVRPARTAAALSAALLVAACGGGGGDNPSPGDDNGGTPQSVQTVSVAGVASKGLLKNAVVKVFALNADGSIGGLLASTRTDKTGHYVTPGLKAGAQVYIEVMADKDTLMADEATGKDLTPSSTFKLRAVRTLSSTPGQDLQQVTPFSDMAVAIAQANGGFKPEVIDAANQRVVFYFNYPVLTTEPTFDANNKPTNPAALNLAAVSALAKSDVFADCKAKTTDVAKVECVVGQLSSKGVGDDDLASKFESAKDNVTYRGKEAVPPVQPQHLPLPVGAVKSGIAEAKALIKNVRSNAEQSVANVLSQRFRSVTEQFKSALTPVDAEGQRLIQLAAQAAVILDNPARELGAVFKSSYDWSDVTCSLYKNDTTVAASYAEVNAVKCNVYETTRAVGGAISTSGENSFKTLYLSHELKLSKTSTVHSYAVESALYSQETVHHWINSNIIFDPVTGQPTYIPYSSWDTQGAETKVSNTNVATITLKPVTGSFYSAMTILGDLAPSSDKVQHVDDKIHVDLSTAASAVNGLTQVRVNGQMWSVINGEKSAQALVNDGSYMQLRTSVPGDIGSALADDQSGSALHLLLSSALSNGATVNGTLEIDLSGFGVAKKNGFGKTSFEGKLNQAGGTLLFDGKFVLTVPSEPVLVEGQDPVVLDGTIQLDGTLALPSRPDMVVHLTTTTNRSSVHSFAGSYEQKDFASVLIRGSVDEGSGNLISLTLSTPSGVTVTVHPNDTSFQIMKGTDVLGVFTSSNGRILYADNTYEQY